MGIHPGVSDGRRIHALVNTAKPHKGGGKLGAKMDRLNRRRLAHAATIKSLPSSVNPGAFKAPGSMNQHKSAPRGRRA